MELSRREAIAALVASGIGIAGGVSLYQSDLLPGSEKPVANLLDTLVPLAEVLYPSEVSETSEFVETYVRGRIEDDEAYGEEIAAAVDSLDARAKESRNRRFAQLSPQARNDLLYELGMEDVSPKPNGTELQRIRYYLINELLYALFTSPKGAKIAGTENPPGYPGGHQSYQRGPQA